MDSKFQIEMISIEDLVGPGHSYRRFKEVFDFSKVRTIVERIERDDCYKGYGAFRLFLCCLLQYLEDVSDRELERFIVENNSAKWFCGFSLTEKTPDHTVFCAFRKRLGAQNLSEIFAVLRDQLKARGLMNEVFSFVDATTLISKAHLWEERDCAKQKQYETLNNESLPKVAHDKQARIGSKGKNKFWYGYKKHVGVDMQSGLINKVAITPANVTDASGFKHVCPKQGAVYADKGYCIAPAVREAKRKGVHLAAIKKNNMKDKNKDKDRWYSGIRAPYERVFAQDNKRARYVGVAKNQFAAFMHAITFNMKRLIVIIPPPKPAIS
jgi:IS5 family transposase